MYKTLALVAFFAGCTSANPTFSMAVLPDDGGPAQQADAGNVPVDSALAADLLPTVVPDLLPPPCGGLGEPCCPLIASDEATACAGFNRCINNVCQPCGGADAICCAGLNSCQGSGRCMETNAGAARCTLETDCGTHGWHCCEGELCGGIQRCQNLGGNAPVCN